jgi:hypothetical protein
MTNLPNWFANDGQLNFETHLEEFSTLPIRALQIGAYAGDASSWMYTNLLKHPDSVLIDVDTWEGSDEPVHHGLNWSSVETIYDVKTQAGRADRKIIKFKGTSDWFFRNNQQAYNFIYIDGDHTAPAVLKDGMNAFDCLHVGGILAFDDYQWSAGLGITKEPKAAIDAFYTVYMDRVDVIVNGYQFWVRKTA